MSKLEDYILADIAEAEEGAKGKVEKIVGSPDAVSKNITSTQVRNLRIEVLNHYRVAKTQLPLRIYNDIALGLDSEMNGITKQLGDLQSALVAAKSEQSFVQQRYEEIKRLRTAIRQKTK
jgi:hypothetical protein